MIDPKTLDEIDRLRKAATPGPWRVDSRGNVFQEQPHGNFVASFCQDPDEIPPEDAGLVVALVNNAPALLEAARERENMVSGEFANRLHHEVVAANRERDAALARVKELEALVESTDHEAKIHAYGEADLQAKLAAAEKVVEAARVFKFHMHPTNEVVTFPVGEALAAYDALKKGGE